MKSSCQMVLNNAFYAKHVIRVKLFNELNGLLRSKAIQQSRQLAIRQQVL